jgi:hypothetical protein
MFYSTQSENGFIQPVVAEYDTHMVMSNVVRTRKKKQINIDTTFFEQSETFMGIFSIHLPDKIKDVTSLQISHMELPISFHTISNHLGNNTFNIIYQNIFYKKTIPNMYYSYENRSLLLNELNKITECTFIYENGSIQIQNKTSDTITIQFPQGLSSMDNIGWLLGFRQTMYSLLPGTSILSENHLDFQPIRYVFLCVDENSNSSSSTFTSFLTQSILADKIAYRISVNSTNYGDIVKGNSLNAVNDMRNYHLPINISKLLFKLITPSGKILPLNGLSYSFVISIEHE